MLFSLYLWMLSVKDAARFNKSSTIQSFLWLLKIFIPMVFTTWYSILDILFTHYHFSVEVIRQWFLRSQGFPYPFLDLHQGILDLPYLAHWISTSDFSRETEPVRSVCVCMCVRGVRWAFILFLVMPYNKMRAFWIGRQAHGITFQMSKSRKASLLPLPVSQAPGSPPLRQPLFLCFHFLPETVFEKLTVHLQPTFPPLSSSLLGCRTQSPWLIPKWLCEAETPPTLPSGSKQTVSWGIFGCHTWGGGDGTGV